MKQIKKLLSILTVIAILSVFVISSVLAATTIYVKTSSADLRTSPSSKSKVAYKVKKNTNFTVVGTSGDWYKVKYNNKTLYIAKSVVAIKAPAKAPAVKYEKDGDLTMSTTTSTNDSGLLDYLMPYFTKSTGIKIKWVSVGTGQSIENARLGACDVVLVHDPSQESTAVKEGFLINGKAIMHNDFLIVGPASDPAGISGFYDPMYAFTKIAAKKKTFLSRADGSGTYGKEMDIWARAGITPDPKSDSWYLETGKGMGATLTMAAQMNGYTLTDIATYIKTKKDNGLVNFVRGHSSLYNPYHAYAVNPKKWSKTHIKSANSFIKWMATSEAQSLIKHYRISGNSDTQVFYPDAIPNVK